jgi:hypothetical protein
MRAAVCKATRQTPWRGCWRILQRVMKRLCSLACGFALCWLGACASAPPLLPGQTEADALQRFGRPTAIYDMGGGGKRLEFASGPYGRQTWMVDLDAAGRVKAVNQVLNESTFASFQGRAPGMTRADLLRTLGTPGERRGGGWQGGQVWSWRYPTNDCLWFQVSIGDDGIVRDGAYGIDPRCDAPSDHTP